MIKKFIRGMGKITDVIDYFSPFIFLLMRCFIVMTISFIFIIENIEIDHIFKFTGIFYIFYPLYTHFFNKIRYSRWAYEIKN